MLESVARRRVVWLAGRRPLLGGSLGEWVIGLRWIAILGMAATTLAARRFVPGLALGPIFGVLGVTACLNVAWIWWIQHPSRWASRSSATAVQLALDVVLLGAVLWFTGGVENPFAIFLTFQVALAALLCGGTAGIVIALLAVAVAAGLAWAPPLPWVSAVVPVAAIQHTGRLAALIGVAAFVGFTAYLYRQRLEALRGESARNERFAVLGRLLAGMAHELNTPLATIVVASDELVAVGRECGNEEVERLSSTISQEAKRASNVISLLRGQLREARSVERVDVSRFLRDVLPRDTESFRGALRVDVPSDLEALAIPAALRQIVGNVVKNAIEAVEGREDARIEVSAEEVGDRVVIRVRDNGYGIHPEDLPHLGEPFLTTKASSGGTGLGLYVSSLLADRMSAVLQIEGGGPSGACVTLSLRSALASGPRGRRAPGDDDVADSRRGWDEVRTSAPPGPPLHDRNRPSPELQTDPHA